MPHAKAPRPGKTGPGTAGEYLTQREVTRRYKISKRTVERLRETGVGPPFVRVRPRRILYRDADWEAWLIRRTHASRAAEVACKQGRAESM